MRVDHSRHVVLDLIVPAHVILSIVPVLVAFGHETVPAQVKCVATKVADVHKHAHVLRSRV